MISLAITVSNSQAKYEVNCRYLQSKAARLELLLLLFRSVVTSCSRRHWSSRCNCETERRGGGSAERCLSTCMRFSKPRRGAAIFVVPRKGFARRGGASAMSSAGSHWDYPKVSIAVEPLLFAFFLTVLFCIFFYLCNKWLSTPSWLLLRVQCHAWSCPNQWDYYTNKLAFSISC